MQEKIKLCNLLVPFVCTDFKLEAGLGADEIHPSQIYFEMLCEKKHGDQAASFICHDKKKKSAPY